MADPFVGFTQKDLLRLKQLLRRVKNDPVNTTGRSPTPVHSVYMDTSQAPEVYIALVPEDGLPGAEHVGTAGGPPTSLSGVECQVYELSTDDGVLRPVDGLTRWVYNLSSRGIRGGGWALLMREKGGEWIATAVLQSSAGDNAGAGQCELALLNSDDCVLITYLNGETGEIEYYYLEWDASSQTWKSGETFLYPGGSGTFEFGYEEGRFRLTLGGLDLINCGDGCYTGSWITGHGTDETGTGLPESTPCNATSFTVCLSCACCPIDGWDGPGWYCVNDLTTGTGTGTSGEECEVQYLMEEDKCDDDLKICSGPYETEAEANAVCGCVFNGTCCDEVCQERTFKVTLFGGTGAAAVLNGSIFNVTFGGISPTTWGNPNVTLDGIANHTAQVGCQEEGPNIGKFTIVVAPNDGTHYAFAGVNPASGTCPSSGAVTYNNMNVTSPAVAVGSLISATIEEL